MAKKIKPRMVTYDYAIRAIGIARAEGFNMGLRASRETLTKIVNKLKAQEDKHIAGITDRVTVCIAIRDTAIDILNTFKRETNQ